MHLSKFPQDWPSEQLRAEDALNGFFLYSLLLHKAEHQHYLVLSHDVQSQRYRLEPALEERNKSMEGIGQEYWAHACDICFRVLQQDGISSMMLI